MNSTTVDVARILASITESVWNSLVPTPLVRRPGPRKDAPPFMTACLHITGPWSGAVTVECARESSTLVAAAMFAMEIGSVGTAEIRDAVGEIGNMIAGNVKPVLSKTGMLSLPTVVQGSDYEVRVPGTVQIGCVEYLAGGHLLRVALFQAIRNAE